MNKRKGEMKKASFFIFIIFILLHIEAKAQSYSILTGIVTEFHGRGLVVKSDEGKVVQLRVGWRQFIQTVSLLWETR